MTLAKEQVSLKRQKGESYCLHEERVDKKASQDLEKTLPAITQGSVNVHTLDGGNAESTI
jgi:hypothetical protein